MAASILKGTPPSELNNLTDAGEPYMVDYSAMKRWNLDFSRLPSGTVGPVALSLSTRNIRSPCGLCSGSW